MRITVAVFSYNRGQFLDNCVQSIERHMPTADILVVDDMSDDAATQAVVENIKRRHTVMAPDSDGSGHKLGGLYRNMQRALDAQPDTQLICYLQDDMQIVRDVSADELRWIDDYFDAYPRAGFLRPTFLKGHHRERDLDVLIFDDERCVYRHRDEAVGDTNRYADVSISRTDRLRSVDWQFVPGEKSNDRQAADVFEPIGVVQHPFAMFLPAVPAHRHRRKTWALRSDERRTGVGFHPYQPLQGDALARLIERDLAVLPVAEDFLETRQPSPSKPWVYGPFQGSRWRNRVHRIEVELFNAISKSR